MITLQELNSLNEDEFTYLFVVLAAEWERIRMPYEFNLKFIKFFRKEAVVYLINKHKDKLKDEWAFIPNNILLKLEE